jgi:hypothetical protein
MFPPSREYLIKLLKLNPHHALKILAVCNPHTLYTILVNCSDDECMALDSVIQDTVLMSLLGDVSTPRVINNLIFLTNRIELFYYRLCLCCLLVLIIL